MRQLLLFISITMISLNGRASMSLVTNISPFLETEQKRNIQYLDTLFSTNDERSIMDYLGGKLKNQILRGDIKSTEVMNEQGVRYLSEIYRNVNIELSSSFRPAEVIMSLERVLAKWPSYARMSNMDKDQLAEKLMSNLRENINQRTRKIASGDRDALLLTRQLCQSAQRSDRMTSIDEHILGDTREVLFSDIPEKFNISEDAKNEILKIVSGIKIEVPAKRECAQLLRETAFYSLVMENWNAGQQESLRVARELFVERARLNREKVRKSLIQANQRRNYRGGGVIIRTGANEVGYSEVFESSEAESSVGEE